MKKKKLHKTLALNFVGDVSNAEKHVVHNLIVKK